MVKCLVLFLSIMIAFNVEAKTNKKNEVELKCQKIEEKVFCIDDKNDPYTGFAEVQDGENSIRANYKNGYYNGEYTLLNKDRIKLERAYYKNGVLNGELKKYELKSDDEETKKGKINKAKSSKFNTKAKEQLGKRIIVLWANYKDGKLDGNFTLYDKDEKIIGVAEYKEGILLKAYCGDKKKGMLSNTEIQQYTENQLFKCDIKEDIKE